MSESTPIRDTGSERQAAVRAGRPGPADGGPKAKTSAAAVLALVFGLIALLSALTGLLAPVAVVFGLIGLIIAVFGIRAARNPLTTGKAVAVTGLVLSVLALLLGIAALVGVASVISRNPQILDQINTLLDNARSQIPAP